jgi:transposase
LGEAAGLFEALPDQAAPERVGGGLPRLRCAERGQIEWRPFSLDELVPEDHRVRLVWRFVEGLDVTPLQAVIKSVDGHSGHPAADPRILLALWLYATVKGIGSAREVARLCEEHVAFRWLCGGVSVNAKTLADFRVDHGAVLERLLVDSFTALVRAGVASLDRVAQDGCGYGPRRERRRFVAIRRWRNAGATRSGRSRICVRHSTPIRDLPAASRP